MLNVLLAIHMIACVALVIAVMLQRSEGGALGMGGGGTGGIISGRGAAGVLVRVTMGLAAVFFTTSVVMTRLNAEDAKAPTDVERQLQERQADVFDPLAAPAAPTPAAPATTAPVVDPLAPVVTTPPATTPAAPAPTTTAPATPAPATPAPAKPKPAPKPATSAPAPATQTPTTTPDPAPPT